MKLLNGLLIIMKIAENDAEAIKNLVVFCCLFSNKLNANPKLLDKKQCGRLQGRIKIDALARD